jgi:hypothetical protein
MQNRELNMISCTEHLRVLRESATVNHVELVFVYSQR